MSIFKNYFSKKTNELHEKNGFYYEKGYDKVIFSEPRKITASFSEEKKLYRIDDFCFFQNDICVSYFEHILIDEEEAIITLNHFAVDTDYLFKLNKRDGGFLSLKEFAKEIKKQLPFVNEIRFNLFRNGTSDKICNFCLSKKRCNLFSRIGAIDIDLKNKGRWGDGSFHYFAVATWPKSRW